MAEDDLATELVSLRAQLQKLEQDRNLRESSILHSPTVIDPSSAPVAAEKDKAEQDEGWLDELEGLEPNQIFERIKAGAGEWFDELDKELKDIKPSTVLTIFGLGVLAGRLTH